MTAPAFSRIAVTALLDMRKRTSAVLADTNATPPARTGRVKRLAGGLALAFRLARRWMWARGQASLRNPADALVLYSPARAPRLAGETERVFLNRIARSNRDAALPSLLGIDAKASIVCLEVRAGLDMAQSASALDYVLARFGWSDIARLARDIIKAPADRVATTAAVAIDLLQQRLSLYPTHVIMLTSNSMLAEFIRLAACQSEHGTLTEVLHGIASVGMEPYYEVIEANAKCRLLYVNLIDGLIHFPSIERHILSDAQGQVAVNCHIWSRIGADRTLTIPLHLIAEQPLVIVGGTSSEKDYFQTRFFESECQLMLLARQQMPHRKVVYCPHPANPETHVLRARLAEHDVALSKLPTFSMLFCASAVVGTYSTSLFEAALLGKRVFLLPFDHSILMPELLENVDFAGDAATLHADYSRFAQNLSEIAPEAVLAEAEVAAARRLGLILRFE